MELSTIRSSTGIISFTDNMRSPITYYGGKSKMINTLRPLVPDHRIYTETFLGGATMFFDKCPSQIEMINDINSVVVNFYEVLRTSFDELFVLINSTLESQKQHKNAYQIYKEADLSEPVKLAWSFWMVCNFSYLNKPGGGFRVSITQDDRSGRSLKNRKHAFGEHLKKRIESAYIMCEDAKTCILKFDKEDAFHFVDPPYLNSDQGHYRGYTEDDFSELLEVLSIVKGKFILTNYQSVILDQFVKKNNWIDMKKRFETNPSPSNKKRGVKEEIIVTNFDPTDRTGQTELFK